jgi:hypothetical protein
MNGSRASAQIYGRQDFPDPPNRSTFNGGVGGSRIGNNEGAYTKDLDVHAQIHDLDWIPDPPDCSTFNGGGGGLLSTFLVIEMMT